jgi:hypothetical protein
MGSSPRLLSAFYTTFGGIKKASPHQAGFGFCGRDYAAACGFGSKANLRQIFKTIPPKQYGFLVPAAENGAVHC